MGDPVMMEGLPFSATTINDWLIHHATLQMCMEVMPNPASRIFFRRLPVRLVAPKI
jgi:hypothetical protein